MKYIKNTYWAVLLLMSIGFSSCESYLDQPVDAAVSDEDVWTKFATFQGFIENIYQCVPDPMCRNVNGYSEGGNYGDELVGGDPANMVAFDDNCAYEYWESQNASPFLSSPTEAPNTQNGDGNGRARKGYWDNGWLGIRMANMALINIDKFTEAYSGGGSLEEQRNILKGQALFFRAYFHFEIIRAWGGVPYIDTFFSPDDLLTLPRLDYHTITNKIADDLRAAAELLPTDWDGIPIGNVTNGNNRGRVTKGAALAYLGKAYLYAASPLMNGTVTGNYTYNEDYCKLAAQAFNELFQLNAYSLVPFDHYYDNFWKFDGTMPLTEETIFNNPVYGPSNWAYGGWMIGAMAGGNNYRSPTHNYAEYYGMANGLPIDADGSGFDAANPFANRDPRFYKDIIIDGDRMANGAAAEAVGNAFAEFFVGGKHRTGNKPSLTGYGWRKFLPLEVNTYNGGLGTNQRLWRQVAEIRLADAYLMYAEAVNEGYGPNVNPSDIQGGMTAAQAVNLVRTRAGVGAVDSRFLSNKDDFMELLRKERASELAFEGHRWYDLRRWYIAHLPQYKEKYALDFDKDHTYFNRRLILTKPFEMKHYWLPFNTKQTSVYPAFYQNPGW